MLDCKCSRKHLFYILCRSNAELGQLTDVYILHRTNKQDNVHFSHLYSFVYNRLIRVLQNVA